MDTDNPVNQSKLEANTYSWHKARETCASELWLILILILIGRESGASFLNHLLSKEKQNQSKRELLTILKWKLLCLWKKKKINFIDMSHPIVVTWRICCRVYYFLLNLSPLKTFWVYTAYAARGVFIFEMKQVIVLKCAFSWSRLFGPIASTVPFSRKFSIFCNKQNMTKFLICHYM